MSLLYKNGNALSADLKRTAHAVRSAVDVMEPWTDPTTGARINPRRRATLLTPQERHRLCHRPLGRLGA
jgi:hypothetical protein